MNKFAKKINGLLQEAAKNIDRYGELPLMIRLSFFDAGETAGDDGIRISSLLFKRTEYLCAVKTFGIWQSRYSDSMPMKILESKMCLNSLKSTLNVDLSRLQTFLDNKFQDGEPAFSSIYAGFSCWAAGKAQLHGFLEAQRGESDIDIEPENWMAAFYSSLAYSGKATWEETHDIAKHREYWTWYIDDCMPNALRDIGCL